MKNFIILGLLALLLFSISAGLSLWLNQSREATEAQAAEKAAGKAAGKTTDPKDKEPAEPRTLAKSEPRPLPAPANDAEASAIAVIKDREAKLERHDAQREMILKDIQSQRDSTETLVRQIAAELKVVVAKSDDLQAAVAAMKKQVGDQETVEVKNIDKIASLYDTMPAETAAPIMKQMAETGRMETAARILAKMKDRNAAAVLSALSDPVLSAQFMEKMRGLKPGLPPAPVGPTGVTPNRVP